MKTNAAVIPDEDIPSAIKDLARRRMRGFTQQFGNMSATMTLDRLCMSCYLQGIRDAAEVTASP